MSTAIVTDKKYSVDPLYQWDQGQVLEIRGLSMETAPEIHFDNGSLSGAIVRQATMDNAGIISVKIPNSLLEKSNKITAYVCMSGEEEFRSLYSIEITVKARKKPEFYEVIDEYEIYSIEALTREVEEKLSEIENITGQYEEVVKVLEEDRQILEESIENYNNANSKINTFEEELEKTTLKVDTIIEQADLGIKNTASGEEIHLTDSAEGKAVEFALYGKVDQETTSGKNLLPYPFNETTHEENGIVWTDLGNGEIIANGTATGLSAFSCKHRISPNGLLLANGSYILSGCPSGGSKATYVMGANITVNGANNVLGIDIGDGCIITVNGDDYYDNQANVGIYFEINKGTTVNNLVFKPMVRLASITDDTWEPYTNGATPRPDYPQTIEVSGESYNLLENTASSQEKNGVVFTVNEDKSITINGTATNNADFYVNGGYAYTENILPISSGEIIVSGTKTNSIQQFLLRNESVVTKAESGENISISLTGEVTAVMYRVMQGTTINSVTIYPMIRKASVKNDSYMPYGVDRVEVKSLGKNRINPNDCTQAFLNAENGTTQSSTWWITTEYINVLPNEQFTFSSNAENVQLIRFVEYNSEKKYIKGSNLSTTEDITLNVGNTTKYIRLSFGIGSAITMEDFFASYAVQLENGKTSTEIETYKETLSTIPTPNGLASVNDSRDEKVKYADGSGESIQRVGKKRITSNMSFNVWATQNGTYNRYMLITNDMKRDDSGSLMCTHLQKIIMGNAYSEKSILGVFIDASSNSNNTYIGFINPDWKTIDDFKAFLDANEVYVLYELATPIRTPLTAEEIAEIEKLHTFYPITNISNDFDCGMSIKYNADSKNYIDKKIAEMFSAMNN